MGRASVRRGDSLALVDGRLRRRVRVEDESLFPCGELSEDEAGEWGSRGELGGAGGESRVGRASCRGAGGDG